MLFICQLDVVDSQPYLIEPEVRIVFFTSLAARTCHWAIITIGRDPDTKSSLDGEKPVKEGYELFECLKED